jgi:hypothetical protein
MAADHRFLCLERIVVAPAGDNGAAVEQQGTRCNCATEYDQLRLFRWLGDYYSIVLTPAASNHLGKHKKQL